MKNQSEYNRGYECAAIEIRTNICTEQELLEASYYAADNNDFDKGWQQACLDNGAYYPD